MKPIYVEVIGTGGVLTGLATASNFVLTGDGRIVPYNNQNQPQIAKMKDLGRKAVVWTLYDLKEKLRNQATKEANLLLNKSSTKTLDMEKRYLDTSYQAVKDQSGQNTARRAETSSNSGYDKVFVLTLNATAATAATDVVLGDGLGFFRDNKGILNNSFTDNGGVIDGTFGAESLNVLAKMAQSAPFVIKGMQIQTTEATGAAFSGNFLNTTQVDAQNVTSERPVSLAIGQDGTQFNQFIRLLNNFKRYMGQWTGLRVRFAQGQSITFTINLESVSDSTLQAKL